VGLSHFFGMKQHDNDYLLERGHEQDGWKNIASKQLPRTSSDSTLLMALQKAEAKINDGFGFSFGLVPILWSTGTELMWWFPLRFRLLEEQSPLLYMYY
jgi:hypothetical protein